MENIQIELNELITSHVSLILTGMTASNGITVNVSHLKNYIKNTIGKASYKKYKDIIIEEVEKLRDRIYSKCRYANKKIKLEDDTEKLEWLINRTKRNSRVLLGSWITDIRSWDSLGCLTFSSQSQNEKSLEESIMVLLNYLKYDKSVTDFFYCIEYSTHYHINFFCKCSKMHQPNRVRQKIKQFWTRTFGLAWVRKFHKEKASKTYWVKDFNSPKKQLSNNCWDFYYNIE